MPVDFFKLRRGLGERRDKLAAALFDEIADRIRRLGERPGERRADHVPRPAQGRAEPVHGDPEGHPHGRRVRRQAAEIVGDVRHRLPQRRPRETPKLLGQADRFQQIHSLLHVRHFFEKLLDRVERIFVAA